jgi:diketogulonate reductase-like aldo/keto reductase
LFFFFFKTFSGGNESIMARQQGKLAEFCNVKGIHVSAWLAAKGRTTAQVILNYVLFG